MSVEDREYKKIAKAAFGKYGLDEEIFFSEIKSQIGGLGGVPLMRNTITEAVIAISNIPNSELLELSRNKTLSLLDIATKHEALFTQHGVFSPLLLGHVKAHKEAPW